MEFAKFASDDSGNDGFPDSINPHIIDVPIPSDRCADSYLGELRVNGRYASSKVGF